MKEQTNKSYSRQNAPVDGQINSLPEEMPEEVVGYQRNREQQDELKTQVSGEGNPEDILSEDQDEDRYL
jgi:hypothetical protein